MKLGNVECEHVAIAQAALKGDQETQTRKDIEKVLEKDILPVEPLDILNSIIQVVKGTQRLRNIFLLMSAQASVEGSDQEVMEYREQFRACQVIYDCLGDILSRMYPVPPEEEEDNCKQGPKEEMPKTAEPKEASAR